MNGSSSNSRAHGYGLKWRLAIIIAIIVVMGGIVLIVARGITAPQQVSGATEPCASPLVERSRPPASKQPATLLTAEDHLALGDCERALAAYSRAIELKPDLAEAYNNRAYTYMAKRDYAMALPDLDKAIQLRPNYVNALMNRGDIYNYYYQIDYDRAVADYDRVLAIDSDAARHSSVCGHRLLAMNHGWNPGVFVEVLTRGVHAGCPLASPAY